MLGDGGDRIAAPAHQRRQPLLLAAHHEGHRTLAERQVVERLVRLPGEPDRPHAELAQLAQRGRHPAHHGEGQVLDGPGGRLGDGRRQAGRAVARQHDAGDAGALGAAQERAQVPGVGDAGRHQQERRRAVPVRAGQVLEGDGLERSGQGEHALRRLGAGLGVEPGPGHGLDGDPQAGGQLLDAVQLRRGVLVLGEHDPAHGAAPDGEQLEHGAAALDLVPAELAQGLGAGAARTGATGRAAGPACAAVRRGAAGSSGSPGLHQHDGEAGDPLGPARARPGPRRGSP